MIRDIFTNKWILGGIAFLIIIAGACLFWDQYTRWEYAKGTAKLEEFVRQWQKDQQAKQGRSPDPEIASPQLPVDSDTPDADKQRNPVTKEITPAHAQNGTETAETETDVKVSPYGFGPYPEVPEGFTKNVGTPIWMHIDRFGPIHPDYIKHGFDIRAQELIGRVLIKVWQDDPESRRYMEGGFHRNGKVYVNYSNRAYVRYKTIDLPDGTTSRVITSWTAGSLKAPSPDPVNPFQSNDDQIPGGIELIDLDKEDPGIDPYSFLGL